MSQKHTAVELQAPSGTQVRAISHENDFPLPAVDELEKLYLLAPIASWPCFIAIFILNLNTKWGKHREKKRLNKQ